MSVDIIARTLARAATPVAATATAIPTLQLALSVGVIQTSGYAVSGAGAGLYVSDALATLALATVHPRFCKQSLDGRYWRLIGDEVTAEQGGALGTTGATNDQPAIQAGISYANAVGIRRVRLTQAYYQLRAPLRANGLGGYDPAGNYLTTTENVALVGVPGRTMLKCYNSNGGTNDTITQTVDGTPWIGPLFYVKPATTIDWVALENVEFDGTVTYTAGVTPVNLSNKGFRIQDTTVNKVEMRNVTFRNCAGEIYYTGGSVPNATFLLENCTFDGSPQSAFNPGSGGTYTCINLQAGNSYQNEIIGGQGMTFIGGRFYKLTNGMSVMGGAAGAATGFVSGYYYSYPFREAAAPPPWVTFNGTRFESCVSVQIGSYVRGKIVTIDTSCQVSSGYGKLNDVDLEIDAWADRVNLYEAVGLSGPVNLTTQVPNTPGGTFYTTPRNVRVKVNGRRTAQAVTNSVRLASLLRCYPSLYDTATCHFIVGGEAAGAVDVVGGFIAGFVWPLVEFSELRTTTQDTYGAINGAYPSANFNLTLYPGPNFIDPQAAGTFAMTLVNTYPFAEGQKVTLRRAGTTAADRWVSLAKSGAGALMSEDRVLYQRSDTLSLRWDTAQLAFVEDGYTTRQALRYAGSATYDAPSIAAGGTTTTTVTVTGAALGDSVDRISFGVDLAGLVATGYVSAANTVTVRLQNPTAGAIDLASTTLRVWASRG